MKKKLTIEIEYEKNPDSNTTKDVSEDDVYKAIRSEIYDTLRYGHGLIYTIQRIK